MKANYKRQILTVQNKELIAEICASKLSKYVQDANKDIYNMYAKLFVYLLNTECKCGKRKIKTILDKMAEFKENPDFTEIDKLVIAELGFDEFHPDSDITSVLIKEVKDSENN